MDHTLDNRTFWQRMARLYAPFMAGSKSLYQAITDRIGPGLDPSMTVLELACGTGQLSFPLAPLVERWEATDFSPAMIQQAQKRQGPPQLHFSVQDATALYYRNDSFDAVVISNALHIMPHPDRALVQIRRVLKPGGVLYAPTFVHGAGRGFRLRARLLELVGFQVYSKWTAQAFADYIASAGFSVTQTAALGSSIAPLCYLEARNLKE